MKKILAILCIAATFISEAAETSSVNYSAGVVIPGFELIWQYETITANGITSATITGVRTSGGDNLTGDLAIPYSVVDTATGQGYVVKEIANGAFANQIGITSFSIPMTVEFIGEDAFSGCTVNSSITVEDNNPWFTSLSGVLYDKLMETLIACPATRTSLTIAESTKTICDSAFASCRSLVEVLYLGNEPSASDHIYDDTPENLTSFVRGSAGFHQTGMKWKSRPIKIGLPATVPVEVTVDSKTYIFNWKYMIDLDSYTAKLITVDPKPINDIEIPGVIVASIGGGTYSFAVTEIGDGAFRDAQALTKVTTSASTLKIGDYAFSNCTALAEVELSYGLRFIGKRPFVNTAIPTLTLPDTLLDMDGNIAAGTIYDMKINISDSSHFTYSDDGVLYNKDMTKLYSCPTRAEGTITMPSTVTNICADAFFGCFRLSYLNIPANVNTIGEGAFNVSGIWPGLSAPESSPKLQSVFYNGSIPNAADDIYEHAPSELISYALDDAWNGRSEWKSRPVTVINVATPPVLKYKDDDGITWFYRIINGTAEIYNEDTKKNPISAISPISTQGILYYDKDSESYSRALKIPSSINGYTVTKIGKNAFENCNAVPCIGIPSCIQEIDDYAFKGCTALRSIDDATYVPFSATGGTISLPVGITKLGYHPFEGIMTSAMTLPYTVTETIGNPLTGLKYTTTVAVDANNPKFYSAGNIIYNKSHSCVIGVPANYDGSSISFLASVTTIGNEALYGCENLSTITLPASLETISTNAFARCTGLSSLTIPKTVTKIESAAFSNCTALAKVTYAGNAPTAANDIYVGTPDTMASWIYEGATGFTEGNWKDRPIVVIKTEDPKDEELSYNNGVATWYFRIVDGMAEIHRDGDRTAVVSDEPIMNLTLPNTLGGYIVKGIGNGALSNLRGITSISVPNTYEWIGDYAFSNCTSLAAISLGNGVEKIGRWPFYGTKLTTLAIPDSVSEIDGNPVAGCSMMTAVSVADSQPYFSVDEDGLLFDKKQETLIACPATKSSITLPDTLKTINDDAFYGCNLMDSASTTIDDATWTFEIHDGKATITDVSGVGDTITIPAALSGYPVTGIADGAFVNCSNITAFASESSSFSTKRGILYSADGSELICVPDTITLPYSIITSNTTIKVTTHTEAGVNGGLPYVNRSTTTNFPSTKVSSVAKDGDISFDELLKGVKKIRGYAFNGVNVFETTCTTNTSADGTAFPVDETANSDVTSTITIICTTYRSEITINTATTELNRNAFKNSGLTCKLVSSMPKVNSNLRKSADTGSATDSTSTYFGYLIDSDGNPAGTIQVKTAKARNGVAKTTTVIQIAGQKKQTIRSSLNASTGKVNGINLTANGTYLSGSYNGYTIEGARNLFTSKNRNETAAANAILESVPSKINIFWAGGTLSAKMARKGKVKISGTLSTGKKASASSQIIIGDEWLCIPVSLPKYSISFLLWISTKDRSITTQGLDGDAIAGEPKALKSGAFFRIDAEEVASTLSKSLSTGVKTEDILMDGIPNGVPVSQNGNAFSVSASASALKLRHTATTGSFKGSFKAYYMQNGKQKSKSVTITGVMIGDCGHGFAMTKKGEPTAISIE